MIFSFKVACSSMHQLFFTFSSSFRGRPHDIVMINVANILIVPSMTKCFSVNKFTVMRSAESTLALTVRVQAVDMTKLKYNSEARTSALPLATKPTTIYLLTAP